MPARFWIGTTSTAWNVNANWSASSGGATGASFPTSADDVTLDVNGNNNCATNVTSACISFTVTSGYTATFSMTSALAMSGNLTLGANMGLAGSAILTFTNIGAVLTSNGKTWSPAMTFNSNGATTMTMTFADNWTIGGAFVAATTNGFLNLSGTAITLSLNGNFNTSGVNSIGGTATIILSGTGTVSTSIAVTNNLTINTAGTITFSGTFLYLTNTLTYTAGTVVTTGSTLQTNGTCTLNTSGMSWNNIALPDGSMTITLSSNLTATGNLTLAGTGSTHTINSSSLLIGGNLTANSVINGILTGSTNLVMNGTGAISMTSITTGGILCNLNFNTAGTITISGTFNYRTGTLTRTAGTITTTGSTLVMGAATTLNTSGMSWNHITLATGITYTINSLLTALGTMTLPGTTAITFIGTAGFTVANLVITTTGAVTHSLLQGNTYTVTSIFNNTGSTNTARVTLASSSLSLQTIFTLNTGATCNLGYLDATRLDSSGGRTIRNFAGTNTGTTNWQSFTDIAFTTTGVVFIT